MPSVRRAIRLRRMAVTMASRYAVALENAERQVRPDENAGDQDRRKQPVREPELTRRAGAIAQSAASRCELIPAP